MVLNISESGVLLDGSAKAMAGLPAQAFAINLSASVIEDMISCVQNGGDIQLALGSNPKFLFDDHELRVPKTSDPSGYDLFRTNSDDPSSASRFPEPTMSILKTPKQHMLAAKAKAKTSRPVKPAGQGEPAAKKASNRPPAKSSNATPNAAARPASSSAKDPDTHRGPEDAAAKLKRSFDTLAADKRENSAVIVGGLPNSKGGKFGRLLETHAAPSPRSLPPSPALSGIGSPSLLPSGNSTQEKAKQQRFPLMHELAVQDLSREELLERWDEGTEEEFNTVLDKVASFDKDIQKWVLRKNCWKDLDIFEYNYSDDDRRQKAIANAIKWFDRNRLSASDPLWQKLLPKAERGKGICLSNLQVTLAKGPVAAKQRTDAASASGGDSDRDDSAASAGKKGKGGEPMSRSNSQTSTGKKKLSASEAQAKRLLSTTKKKPLPAPTTKAASKTSAPKPAAKAAPAKGKQVLSKEFVSDSSSSDDEVPLSSSKGKPQTAGAPAPKPTQRVAQKPKVAAKSKEVAAPRPKPAAAAKVSPREPSNEREKDTIRAQVIAKPIRPTPKRSREADDDDSSSSGTPLMKRVKPPTKPLPAPTASTKARSASDASQSSRGTGHGAPPPKAKNNSPVKSSPLASSPPTNATDVEQDRATVGRARERERERERERRRETAVRSSSSNTDSSSGISVGTAKKRPPTDSLQASRAKRQRPSQETVELAAKFRQFYSRYEQLHQDIASHDNPDPDKLTDLLDMHKRLSRMKDAIYAAVEV